MISKTNEVIVELRGSEENQPEIIIYPTHILVQIQITKKEFTIIFKCLGFVQRTEGMPVMIVIPKNISTSMYESTIIHERQDVIQNITKFMANSLFAIATSPHIPIIKEIAAYLKEIFIEKNKII